MTTKNTRRDFTDEFTREAVSLLRGSGRPLTQVAAELGLQPGVSKTWGRWLARLGLIGLADA